MSEQSTFVPYLYEQRAHFRLDFVFFDSALTTSEIKPLHLSVPGTKHLAKKQQQQRSIGPRSAQERLKQQQQQQKEEKERKEREKEKNQSPEKTTERKPMQRLLSPNRSLNVKPHEQANAGGKQENEQKEPSKKVSTAIPRAKNSSASSATGSTEQLPKQKSNESLPSDKQIVPKQGSGQQQQSPKPMVPQQPVKLEFSLVGFYLLPCLQSQTINLIFRIDDTIPNSISYQLEAPDEYDDKLRLRVQITGKTRDSSVEIFYNDMPVGEFRYNPANKSFSVGITSFNPPLEAAAILFNPSFSTMDMPRIFDLLIPALKKVDGRNQMYKLAYNDQSVLIQYTSRMARESIRLKTKIPSSQGNVFDTTFNGKFKHESPLNFILYHESNPKREIAIFSMIDKKTYNLTVTYPLSPMQAFFAAVAISIPF